MLEKLVALGHITEDTVGSENIIGGGVSYSGFTAGKFGFDVGIITKIPHGHRFIDVFSQYGIAVMALTTQSENITTFSNQYDARGKRQQMLQGEQEAITLEEISTIPDSKLDADCILVAPVINEVDTKAIPLLARHGLVAVSPQGYFRETGDNKIIYQKEWRGFEEDLSHASITIFSNEDISVGGVLNESLLNRISSCSPITILTEGQKGSTTFIQGQKAFEVRAFPLTMDEIRLPTGTGDTFTGAFLAMFIKRGDPYKSAVFASLVAAIKMAGFTGRGVDSIPNRDQIEQFLERHNEALNRFLSSNQVSGDLLSF
jgi:sugar/nucleoside kinase (ribokinase family)